ncbi:MAG: hypothetical protein GDA36_06415 [Rhodobacteraceae bacterium]|nr:hypothetical protein [Paracoccaceae bacterium]
MIWPFCPVRWLYLTLLGQGGFDGLVMRLSVFAGCGDPVCGATQVLPGYHQRQSGVLFWSARTTIGRCFIVA